MKINHKMYKYISHLNFLRATFYSLLFIFLINYISETYTICTNLISNNTIELSNNFEDGNKEESEKNERETELEDTDEYVVYTFNFAQLTKSNIFLNSTFEFLELSILKEVDSPPPIC